MSHHIHIVNRLGLDVCITNKSPDQDIIAEISGHAEEESDEEEVSAGVKEPSFNGATDAITALQNFNLFSTFATDLMKALEYINRAVDIDSQIEKRQSIIAEFLV